MIRFEAYKGGLFKADLAEGVWIYFHSSTIIYLIILFSFYSLSLGKVGHIGISSIFIAMLYYINLKFISTEEENSEDSEEETSSCSLPALIF